MEVIEDVVWLFCLVCLFVFVLLVWLFVCLVVWLCLLRVCLFVVVNG